MEHSDQELFARLREGDHTAFTELYNRYWSVLYLHARHMLGESEQARDVIQEVFTGLWNKAGELELHVSLKAYLYKSVRNTILNLIRREKVQQGYMDELSHLYNEGSYDTEEQLRFNELSRLIEGEVEMMPPKMRAVFEMSRKQYLSHAEIASKLSISDSTVKKQVNKALRILRLRLNVPITILLILSKII